MQFPIPNLSPENRAQKCLGHWNNQVWNVTLTTNLGIWLWGTIIAATIIIIVMRKMKENKEMENEARPRQKFCNKNRVCQHKMWDLEFGIWNLESHGQSSRGNRFEVADTHSTPKFRICHFNKRISFRFALVLSSAWFEEISAATKAKPRKRNVLNLYAALLLVGEYKKEGMPNLCLFLFMNPFARINLIEPSMSHKNGAVRQLTRPTDNWPTPVAAPTGIYQKNPFESNQNEAQPRLGDVATKNKRIGYYSQ